MTHKFGRDVLLSIEKSARNTSMFEVGDMEDDVVTLRCNAATGQYEAADMIHLYIEHWSKVNSYKVAVFDENRLDEPDHNGRIFDSVFYDFYREEDCLDGLYSAMFVFDVTEPVHAAKPSKR